MEILVCDIIEKDGKYLLVKEAKPKCYGKWNLPAGHLEAGESVFKAAVREAKEETNCDIEVTALCRISNIVYDRGSSIALTFTTKLLSADIRPREGEILDVRWFTYDEILAMRDKIRSPELTIPDLDAARSGKSIPLDFISIIEKELR